MEQPKPPQPEKKLLTEIAHLTNLLHGSKLKASIRSQHQHHHHRQSTPNLHHNILLRKTNPSTYVGKRMTYRAHQPYFVRLNRASDGSNRKSNLALSKCFRTLRTTSSTSSLYFKSGKQSTSSSTTSRIKHNNSIHNRNTTFSKINRNSIRKNPITSKYSYLTKTKIASLTKRKFHNSTGTARFPSYFSPLQPPKFPNKSSSSSAVVLVPAATSNSNNSTNNQILSKLQSYIPIEYQKIKSNENVSKSLNIITSKTTNNNIPTASATSLTISNSHQKNPTTVTTTSLPSSLTQQPIKEKRLKKEKEPEKSNRYYEIQPQSSPIQAIIQRRCHPDSVSIYRSNTNSTSDTMTTSNDFNFQKQSNKSNSLSPSSSSEDDDDDGEEEVDEDDGKEEEQDSRMISSSQEDNKNTKLAMDIHNDDHCDIIMSNKCNNETIGDDQSTKKSNSTKDGFTCKESCICDSCNGNLDQDIQFIKIVDKIVYSNDKIQTILSTSTKKELSCENLMHDLAENSEGDGNMSGHQLKEQVKQKLGQEQEKQKVPEKEENKNHSLAAAAAAKSKTVEDPRRNRLLSKLSKLSSYKERHLNDDGKSQMPSYFPC